MVGLLFSSIKTTIYCDSLRRSSCCCSVVRSSADLDEDADKKSPIFSTPFASCVTLAHPRSAVLCRIVASYLMPADGCGGALVAYFSHFALCREDSLWSYELLLMECFDIGSGGAVF